MSLAKALAKLRGITVPFELRYVNTKAPAITPADIATAATTLGVSTAHIRMVRTVESGGKSYDDRGRPVILFEPHIFHRRTDGKFSPSSYSYAAWGAKPYPKGYDARWLQMAEAAGKNEAAALESASWGLFQIMGFHWKALGYASADAFARAMVSSEAAQLGAVVRFIQVNGLAGALRRCKPGDPESCKDFARGYNGGGYARNRYHIKMAEALR